MMNMCKRCKYWDASADGTSGLCDKINCGDAYDDDFDTDDKALIEFRVSDDSGLDLSLRTSPDFGCALYIERNPG